MKKYNSKIFYSIIGLIYIFLGIISYYVGQIHKLHELGKEIKYSESMINISFGMFQIIFIFIGFTIAYKHYDEYRKRNINDLKPNIGFLEKHKEIEIECKEDEISKLLDLRKRLIFDFAIENKGKHRIKIGDFEISTQHFNILKKEISYSKNITDNEILQNNINPQTNVLFEGESTKINTAIDYDYFLDESLISITIVIEFESVNITEKISFEIIVNKKDDNFVLKYGKVSIDE